MAKAKRSGLWARLKARLHPADRIVRDLKKVEKLTETEQRREDLKKRLFSTTHHKEKVVRHRRSLQEILDKAGLGIAPGVFRKRIFLWSVIVTLVLSAAVVVAGIINSKAASDVLVFMAGLWTFGFVLVVLLAGLGTAAFLDIRIHNRRKEVELVLPDYLQLAAANIGAGMTIDRALWYAVRPRFGVLAKEMEDVAKQVLTGAELDDALRGFSTRYESPIVERSMSLLLEGIAAGGKIADLLHKISTDIQESRILQKEMAANVTTYVIFISFASVIAAPVLFGLSTQLLVVIKDIAANIGTDAAAGALTVSPDVIKLVDFHIFAMAVLSVSSMMSAFIISVIRRGEALEGLRYLPFFLVISLALYWASVFFFGSMFGSLV